MSTVVLTDTEKLVLDKGLKFAPSRRLNKFQTYIDIHKFVRKLSIKRYISSNPIPDSQPPANSFRHSGLTNASLFNSPGALAPSLKVFRDVVLRDFDQVPINRVKTDREFVAGLDSLCEKKDLVIRPADKGGIIILDKKDYLTEMHRILGDRDTYNSWFQS